MEMELRDRRIAHYLSSTMWEHCRYQPFPIEQPLIPIEEPLTSISTDIVSSENRTFPFYYSSSKKYNELPNKFYLLHE